MPAASMSMPSLRVTLRTISAFFRSRESVESEVEPCVTPTRTPFASMSAMDESFASFGTR